MKSNFVRINNRLNLHYLEEKNRSDYTLLLIHGLSSSAYLWEPITKKFRKHGPYPYYGATGIVDYVDDYIFNETLVLVGEDGAKWDVSEKTAFIVSGKYWVNNHAHVLKPHSDKLSNKWLVYYLNGIDLKPWITGLTVPKLNQENLKKVTNITKLEKIKSDYMRGFKVDIYKLKLNLPDGTYEQSTRWITKHGITLKEVGFIDGKEGKIHFYSEFSNVRVFKQDDRLFDVPEGYRIAPIEELDDVNELLKIMVKRS